MSNSFVSVRVGLFAFAVIVSALSSPVMSTGAKGTTYAITIAKTGTMNGDPIYHCWVPENVGTVRCIIVHQHGCGRDADGPLMPQDVYWTQLAAKWHGILIAPEQTTGSNCGDWNNPDNGSNTTFLQLLDNLATRTSHPEVKRVPWAMWGHSGGSRWVTSMLGKYPKRIAALIAQSCGADVSGNADALRVPVLHHNGHVDLCDNTNLFTAGRSKGALWAHAVKMGSFGDAPTGHECGDLRMLAIPWIDYCLSVRLPQQAGDSTLLPMDTTNAWLGDPATHAIAAAASYSGNKLAACWFPNRALAGKWAEYAVHINRNIDGSTVTDSTPPDAAPTNLQGTFGSNRITLTWDAAADLESGIKTFIIYKNGTKLTTLTYPVEQYGYNPGGYQRWGMGDEPVFTPAPAMTYADAAVTSTGTYTYQVSTVNWSDKEGPKSATVSLNKGVVEVSLPKPVTESQLLPPDVKNAVLREGMDYIVPAGTKPHGVKFCNARGAVIASMRVHAGDRVRLSAAGGVVFVK